MTRREAWLTALAIFAAAVAVRVVAAGMVPFPIPEDAAYYWGVARNLAEGRGLVSDAMWSYATPARDTLTGGLGLFFPRPAFEIWLPLPALLALVPMTLLGSTAYGATLAVPVLLGGLVPVLAWRLAADVAEERALPVGRARVLAVGVGLVAAVYAPLVLPSALLDSTVPFGVAALAACLLMTRLRRDPRGARVLDPRLLGLGVLLALAAYARNEAVWLAAAWVAVAWSGGGLDRATRLRLVAVPGVVALLCFAPWLARDWLVFGTPLPGQALSNAFTVTGYEIFAWKDPPTLAGYLALGPGEWIGQRVAGLGHNLLDVLLLPGMPVALVGLASLPLVARSRAMRPVLILGLVVLAVATLVFPVQTRWGTFLHAALPVQVALLVAAGVGLDALLVAVGRRRGWTRPVAWLGPLFLGSGACLFVAVSVASYGAQARSTADRYGALGVLLAEAGAPLSAAEPVIANHPIWIAEVDRVRTLALPEEAPADVLDLARTFGAKLLVIDGDAHGRWPAILNTGGPDAACFVPLALDPARASATGTDAFRAWRIVCP